MPGWVAQACAAVCCLLGTAGEGGGGVSLCCAVRRLGCTAGGGVQSSHGSCAAGVASTVMRRVVLHPSTVLKPAPAEHVPVCLLLPPLQPRGGPPAAHAARLGTAGQAHGRAGVRVLAQLPCPQGTPQPLPVSECKSVFLCVRFRFLGMPMLRRGEFYWAPTTPGWAWPKEHHPKRVALCACKPFFLSPCCFFALKLIQEEK